MDMGRSQWNKGFIGTFIISISTTVLFVRDNIPWYDSYYDLRLYVESYVEKCSIPSKRYV